MTDDRKEIAKIKRKLNNARREILRAVERAAKVNDEIGLRPGHLAEMRRRAIEVRDEAQKAVETFEGSS